MPAKLEQQLKRQAKSKGLKGDRANAFVYGTLRKTGWAPSGEKRGKTGLSFGKSWRGKK
jgi:hypothetical protein